MLVAIWMALEDEQQREFMHGIYQKHARLMLYTANQILRDPAAAEDVLQDSVVRLMDKIELLQKMDGCTLTAYVVSTIRNMALNRRRAQQRQRYRDAGLEQEALLNVPDGGPTVEEGLLLREQKAALAKIWPRLTEDERHLLEAKYILQQEDKDIAGELGIKPASVRMGLTRARRHALKLMQKEGAADEK